MTKTTSRGEDYKLVSGHSEDLADGHMLEPGQTATLTEDDLDQPHNQRLIDAGLLIKARSERGEK